METLLIYCTIVISLAGGSLVPRFSTLERKHWSCAGRESLVFILTWAVSKVDGVEWLIMRGHTRRLRTRKREKVVGYLLHISSYQGANIIHTKRWTNSWLNNVPFCSKNCGPVSIMSHEKKYQVLPACTYSHSGRGSLGTRLSWSI